MRVLGCVLFVFGLLLSGCSRPAKCPVGRVDLEVLLSRMTNLNSFAETPLGDSFLESSYDRSGGNCDWATYYGKEQPNGRVTIFKADNPGYISRIWIASYYAKRWLFFFDGEETPRINLAQEELFGEKFPFAPPLAGQSGGGRYSLVPIPFSKSLRIEIEPNNQKPGSRNYFHINHTRLNLTPDAVESFPKTLSAAQSNLVEAVNRYSAGVEKSQKACVRKNLAGATSKALAPWEAVTFWEDAGEGVLESFAIKINAPSAAGVMGNELLRKLRLQLFWDGESQPSVDVPLGDFFCNSFYLRSFASMPLAYVDGAFVCRFPMPYKKGARCVLKNTSGIPVSISIGTQGNRNDTGGLHRKFHAVWHASNTSGHPFQMLKTSGSGHYVGCFLTAIGQDGSWTILEGDEFLRPDPETQPPQLGTGLEDYFNGAYYYTSLFDLPLHGLIEKGAMRTDQYRFHLLEAVPFEKSFEAGIEFGDRNHAQGYMSSVLYWYADQATAVPLSVSESHLLIRPPDRFELPGLLSQLFLLERDGLYADAAVRMDFFARRHIRQPWRDLLKVRALGYREKTEGFEAVRAEYEAFTQSAYPPAAQAARDHLWLKEDPAHALLGIHALGKYNLLLDGKSVANGLGKGELKVHRLSLEKGDYQWDVTLQPTRQGSFFSLCLRTQAGDITSAGEWDLVSLDPLPGRKPPEEFIGKVVLPNMTVWAFEPNAYVGMQSPFMGINLWSFWDSKPLAKKIELRKSWSLGEQLQPQRAPEQERTEEELKAHGIN